jgi:hypothetical protein
MTHDERILRETFAALRASEETRQEVLHMQENTGKTKPAGRRALTLALAAALVLALAVGAMAVGGVFRMSVREAQPEETFAGPSVVRENGETETYYWDGAKLVCNFDGPDECSRIRFKPNEMPYDVNAVFSSRDTDGWYSVLSCEGCGGGSEQPCRIDVYYAPQFVDGGNLLLLYADNVTEIEEGEWNGCRVTKFQTEWENHNFPEGEHIVDCSYYILYQPEQGYIITVSSMQDNLDELEQIAQSLEIEQTDEIVSAANYQGHNEFLDCGIG